MMFLLHTVATRYHASHVVLLASQPESRKICDARYGVEELPRSRNTNGCPIVQVCSRKEPGKEKSNGQNCYLTWGDFEHDLRGERGSPTF